MFKNPELATLTQDESSFESAVDLAKKHVESAATPQGRLSARADLAFALALTSRWSDAGAIIEDVIREARGDFEGTFEENHAWLVEALIADMSGDPNAASRRLSRLVARLRDRPHPDDLLSRAAFAYANILNGLDQREEAARWLAISDAANPLDAFGERRRLKTLLMRTELIQDADERIRAAELAVSGIEKLLGANHLDRADALLVLARINAEEGRAPGAEAAFQEARRLYEQAPSPKQWGDPIAQCTSGLANLYTSQGRYQEALAEWRRALPLLNADHPNRPQVLSVIEHLEAALAEAPPNDEDMSYLAAALAERAARDEAIIAATLDELRAAASDDELVETRANRLLGDGGICSDGADADADDVRDHWRAVSARFHLAMPELVAEVRHARALARRRLGKTLEAWVDALVAEAEASAFEQGEAASRSSELAAQLRDATAQASSSEPARAYEQLRYLTIGIQLNPTRAGALEHVAAALTSWQPSDPVFLFALGIAKQARDAFDEAAELYERVSALVPSALGPDVRLSQALHALAPTDERVAAAQSRALRKMNTYPADSLDQLLASMSGLLIRTLFAREHYMTLLGMNRAGDALDIADWLTFDDAAFGHFARGFALATLKREEEAIEAYTRSIEAYSQGGDIEDHSDRAYYCRACAFALTDRPDQALDDLSRAIELDPQHALTAQNEGDLRSLRDDPRFLRLVDVGGALYE